MGYRTKYIGKASPLSLSLFVCLSLLVSPSPPTQHQHIIQLLERYWKNINCGQEGLLDC